MLLFEIAKTYPTGTAGNVSVVDMNATIIRADELGAVVAKAYWGGADDRVLRILFPVDEIC